jgi:hypothetical protein
LNSIFTAKNTNPMEKSTAQVPENLSTTLVIIRLVGNMEFRYIFSQNPDNGLHLEVCWTDFILTPYSFKITFNIIRLFKPTSSWLFFD